MADQATQLKTIADALEGTYQALRRAAGNIAGLLQLGKATCDEVKAYNLWALAIYNTQRGMLASLRAGGEPNVPDLPPAPTLFAWRGMRGQDAVNFDCTNQPKSLSGLMGRVLKGPDDKAVYVSSQDVEVVTQDQFLFNPEAAPSFKTLLQIQAAREQTGAGVGIAGVLIAIAGIAIAVSVAIASIMSYLKESGAQEERVKETQAQADAFANYTNARLQCLATCQKGGQSAEDCIAYCKRLIAEPKIKVPGQDEPWGLLQWLGFTAVTGFGLVVAIHAYNKHREGKPVFELPESVEDALSPNP